MKNPLLFLAAAMVVLGVTACGGSSQDNTALQSEVIAVHDEIMPLMEAFARKSMKIDYLLNNLDSLKAADPELDTVAKRTELATLKLQLDEASDAMTTWMHEFEPDTDDRPDEEVRRYLEGEKTKVQTLKIQFEAAKAASEHI